MRRLNSTIAWSVQCVSCSDAAAPAGIVGRRLDADVPGCVHLDLMRAGVIGDPDLGDGEAQQAWIGHATWRWRGEFTAEGAQLGAAAQELVFESIDTRAAVWLNGTPLGTVANQFHPHRFAVRGVLREGANTLEVEIAAPVDEVLRLQQELGPRPVNGDWTPYPFLRKSACSFGWDWGPRTPSSGFPGPVWFELWDVARIAQVRPLVTGCTADEATVEVHAHVVRAGGGGAPLTVEAELDSPDGRRVTASAFVDAEGNARIVLVVPRPMRWWPRGHGAQHLCDLRVRLGIDEPRRTVPLAQWRRRIGLRAVALETGADAIGTRFAFRINGREIPIVGANWIPAGLFPVAVPQDRIDALLELACDAHLNMLRVWGGGVYESERFYERCDEFGLLVWQDFMFACATYPEEAPMPASVEAEARHQVARLSAHPCVVLWCGGNEDVLAWQSWGFKERLTPGQSWGWKYWSELLPRVCREVDPTRPYWTESPWSGSLDRHANDPDHGDRHTWDLKVEAYRTVVPRFTSEFGHQSPPNRQTLVEALGESALKIGAPALARRQRASGGDAAQYEPFLAEHFHPARDFDEWLYQAQLLQARAMRTAIAWLRANQPRSMGSLFWQWNDVWSGHSWSAIDAKLRPKPFWHALRACAAPRMVTIEPLGVGAGAATSAGGAPTDSAPQLAARATNALRAGAGEGGNLRIALVNDTESPWRATIRVLRIGLDGRVRARATDRVEVAPCSVDATLAPTQLVGAPEEPGAECLLAEVDDQRAWWWWRRDVLMPRSECAFDLEITGAGDRWTVRVRARGMVRDLWIEPRAAWRSCTPNLLTLLPGEDAVVEIELEAPQDQAPALAVHCS